MWPKSAPVVIAGKPLGRFKASFLLLKETWRFMLADAELLLVPIIATIMLIGLFGLLLIAVLASGTVDVNLGANTVVTSQAIIFVVGSYLISAFTVTFARAMVVFTVHERAKNGNASLGQSFTAAARRTSALFLFACVQATVGIVLNALAERSRWLGKFVIGIIGGAWNVLTYFVVPVIMLEEQSAFKGITRSGQVFRQTWGESLISNISLGLAFFVLHCIAVLAFLGVFFLGIELQNPSFVIVGVVVWLVWLFAAIALEQVLRAILVTLLYLSATTDRALPNFNQELLHSMLVRQRPVSTDTVTVTTDPNNSSSSSSS